MQKMRRSGVLLHPTSLPSSAGIGTLGKESYAFVDWLKSAGQTLWQVLPLGPTGYGDSPYASFSTFAGNPLLIDLDFLAQDEFLTKEQIIPPDYITYEGGVDFGSVVYWKIPLLKTAAKQFLHKNKPEQKKDYESFKKMQNHWLENYAVFMSIKEVYDAKAQKENKFGAMWSNYWDKPLAVHDEKAVAEWQKNHMEEIEIHMIIQWFFFTQWNAVKKYANDAGILIIGDIPIFVASDSADVWANQPLFQLDKNGRPICVAGVPPDYFSATGQLWGNPLYDWKKMKKDGYEWWIKRIQGSLAIADIIRIDHFRGFEAFWQIPAEEKTAINGTWVQGPDHDLFAEIQKKLGNNLPLIAEDLGLITDGVKALRDDFKFPGMKILQFAFDINEAGKGGFTNSFLPHMYSTNCIVYTGTHDNSTMQGWLNAAKPEEIKLIQEYLGGTVEEKDLCQALVRLAISSTAESAVIPMQDLFQLGDEARMNIPSTLGGINWQWRMKKEHMSAEKARWLKRTCALYGRNTAGNL